MRHEPENLQRINSTINNCRSGSTSSSGGKGRNLRKKKVCEEVHAYESATSKNYNTLMEPKLLMSEGDLVSYIRGPAIATSPLSPSLPPPPSLTRRRAHYFKKIAQKYQQQLQPQVDSQQQQQQQEDYISRKSCSKSMQNQIIGAIYCIDGDIMKRKIKQQPYFNVSRIEE